MQLVEDEEWRPVVGYEGCYEVSSLGRVRSLDRIVGSGYGYTRTVRGQPIKLQIFADPRSDYQCVFVHLRRDGKRRTRLVSGVVAESFIGPRPRPSDEVCHNDGNPLNNQLSNLRYGSRSDNVLDSIRHGTHAQTSKTHCPRGHPLKMPNLPASKIRVGHRQCLACNRASMSNAYRRRTGKPTMDMQDLSDYYYSQLDMEGYCKDNYAA